MDKDKIVFYNDIAYADDTYTYVVGAKNNVTTPVFHKNTTTIGEYAFAYLTLDDLTFPENLTTIEENAFKEAEINGTVTFNKKIENIGDSAFEMIDNIKGIITFPTSLKSIGKNAFYGVNFNNTVSINSNATMDRSFEGATFKSLIYSPITPCDIHPNAFAEIIADMVTLNKIENITPQAFNAARIKNLLISKNIKMLHPNAFGKLKYVNAIREIHIDEAREEFLAADKHNAEFAEKFKEELIFDKKLEKDTLETMLSNGKSISEINQIYKIKEEVDR